LPRLIQLTLATLHLFPEGEWGQECQATRRALTAEPLLASLGSEGPATEPPAEAGVTLMGGLSVSSTSKSAKVAIVTGASRSAGIGAAICRALAADGVNVCFTHWRAYDRTMPWGGDDKEPDELRRELLRTGVRVMSLEADLSLPSTPSLVLDRVTDELGEPSILVNNAAHSTSDGYEALDAETLDAHYAVNLRATALLSVEFARRFSLGSGGRIVNLTSGQSLGPMPGELAYAATKGAIEAFTVSLAAGIAHRGITVNAVNPGPTDTGWMSADLKARVLERSPLGRIGRPEDAARLVAFLVSDEAMWITGQVIHSEGGFARGS
jgi:3-oxoacyl-[acyl-carrier protein] reductase